MPRRAGLFPALVLAISTAAAAPQDGALGALLPADGAVPGWSRDGAPQAYEGEDLYAYINGGAEIYQEYGFRRVIVQDYGDAADRSVSLEIFEMASPAAAFGMFTFKRSGGGRPLGLGNGAELEAYYLNFWKGRFLVTLTGFDETAATLEGLAALAGAVDASLRDSAAPPALVAALPEDGLAPGSVKYVRGLIGLNNIYAFGTARGLAFAEAVRGLYGNGAGLVVLEYAAAGARVSAGRDLGAYLQGSDTFASESCDEEGVRVFRDGKGRRLALSGSGSRLLVGIGPDAGAVLDLVRRAR